MAETGVVLQVSSLRVETIAGDAIVDDVAFELTRGEVLALVGESGCGKTTTALALMGHARSGARIAAGSVTLGATSVISSRSVRLRGHNKVLCHLMFGILALTVEQLMRLLTQPRPAAAARYSRARQPDMSRARRAGGPPGIVEN